MLLTLLPFLALVPSSFAYNYSAVAEHCDDIWNFTGDAGLEAPTTVTNVTYVAASGTTPAYCQVTATVETYTGIELYIPAEGSDWKGIYSASGCGGSCGAMGLDYVYGYGSGPFGAQLLERGYVASMTDMGHKNSDYANGGLSDWSAFRNNRTVEYNFAFYSTHLLAVSAKAMTEFYYEKPIIHSYYRGGSTGGRQGLIIAERYPHDFDALIIGYAATNETGIGAIQFPWLANVSSYANGSFILTAADVVSLNVGAVALCDGNDGLLDGIMSPLYACDFKPISILCTANFTTNCLSNMDKVEAAEKMYSYPSNSFDDQIIASRYLPGSELEWATWTTVYGYEFAQSFTRDAGFQEDLPLNFTIADYDWETLPYLTGPMQDIYGPNGADLSVFKNKGGKIIHYQGLADANVSPEWNLHWYQHLLSVMGSETSDFYRFFMYPGMAHIDVGNSSETAFRCEYYDYLEAWYLEGQAPDSLLINRFNVTSNETLDYRVYFPYPAVSVWEGEGLPDTIEAAEAGWVASTVPVSQQGVGFGSL